MATSTPLPRICPECGEEFAPAPTRGRQRVFCSDAHKEAHANRCTVRGKMFVKIAQGWRATAGKGDFGKFLFNEMTAMLDEMIAEDRAAGRMRADVYAKMVTEFKEADPRYYPAGYTANRFIDRKAR